MARSQFLALALAPALLYYSFVTYSQQSTGKLVLIIGPSGVGKSVILKELRSRHPEFHFPKSATTRKRREGEGDDLYNFVSDEEFDAHVEEGEVLEWAVVHGGARYGTLAEEIVPYIEEGRTVIREVDVQGFDSIRNHQLFRRRPAEALAKAGGENPPYALQSIFILPENEEQLVKRITKRAPIDDDELNRRKASIEKELTYADLCDAKINNVEGKLDDTVSEVEKIII